MTMDMGRRIGTFQQHIVGVARGGLIPAIILSHKLGLPLTCADYSSKAGAGDDKRGEEILPDLPYGSSILIVDDIADTGKTLEEIEDVYILRGHKVFTAALYYKKWDVEPHFTPTFYAKEIPEDAPWVVFPWE